MTSRFILSVLGGIVNILSMSIAEGQQLPYIKDASVKAKVDVNSDIGIYNYTYSVRNGELSDGKIDAVEIDISRDVLSVGYDTTGLRFANRYTEGSFRRVFPTLADRIVPVGFPSLPRYWFGHLTDRATASFWGNFFVLPGQTRDSLVLSSKGLPGVREFVARPVYDPSDYYPSLDDVSEEEGDRIAARVDSDYVRLPFRGKTIGPTAPPGDFVATTFLETIVSYKHRALELGWIDNEGIAKSLDAKLDNVKKQLQKGKTKTAKNLLKAFLNEVEAQKDKHLSSEAYALLKFNGEFLLGKL